MKKALVILLTPLIALEESLESSVTRRNFMHSAHIFGL